MKKIISVAALAVAGLALATPAHAHADGPDGFVPPLPLPGAQQLAVVPALANYTGNFLTNLSGLGGSQTGF
ncbi:hypothetical protein ABZ642_16410 [Streptomyces sp. NPDC007157]|uniref:hypothetical protein n=1 Tax=Streptomyces sp. NPDC007157 TaxID=3154681 RepID=UPI0033CCD893